MLSLAMGTSGCGKNKKSSAATRSLGRSPVGGNPTNSTNGIPNSQLANQTDSLKNGCNYTDDLLPGFVYVNATDDGAFYHAVHDFLTVFGDPINELGLTEIHGTCGASTGIRFNAKVNTNYEVDVVNGTYTAISGAGELFLGIFDQASVTDSAVEAFQVVANSANGSVSGMDVYIEFPWAYGKIVMEGQIINKILYGGLHFENNTHYNGEAPYKGTFGDFAIPACKIFNCK